MSEEELKQWRHKEDMQWIKRINKKIELMHKLQEEKQKQLKENNNE